MKSSNIYDFDGLTSKEQTVRLVYELKNNPNVYNLNIGFAYPHRVDLKQYILPKDQFIKKYALEADDEHFDLPDTFLDFYQDYKNEAEPMLTVRFSLDAENEKLIEVYPIATLVDNIEKLSKHLGHTASHLAFKQLFEGEDVSDKVYAILKETLSKISG